MQFTQSIKTCFSKYSSFTGVGSKSEFWWYALTYFLLTGVLVGIGQYLMQLSIGYQLAGITGNTESLVVGINLSIYSSITWAIIGILWTIVFIPFLAAGSRRLHDINLSSKWLFIQLTGIGYIWLIIWWSLKTPPTFTFRQSISSCWSKYFRFAGQNTRSEFWWFTLYTTIALIVLAYIYLNLSRILYILANQDSAIWTNVNMLWQVISFSIACLIIIPWLSAGSRRLHAINKSGWFQLLIPTGIGLILLAFWWSQQISLSQNRISYTPNSPSLDWEPVCDKCGNTLNPTSAFCTTCGASQTQTQDPEPDPLSICITCQAPLNPNSAFCTTCGASQTQTQDPEPDPLSVCITCQAPLNPNSAFCTICGASQTAEPELQTCSSCGKQLLLNSKFCPDCGTPIN